MSGVPATGTNPEPGSHAVVAVPGCQIQPFPESGRGEKQLPHTEGAGGHSRWQPKDPSFPRSICSPAHQVKFALDVPSAGFQEGSVRQWKSYCAI